MRPCVCDRAACRLCWLFFNDARYHALWSGVPLPPPPAVRRSLPCLHLGTLLERKACLCPRRDVRHCDRGHGRVSQVAECELCPDYEADEVR